MTPPKELPSSNEMKRGMRSEMLFAAQQRSGGKFDPAEIKSGVIATAAARKQKTEQIVATAAWLSTSEFVDTTIFVHDRCVRACLAPLRTNTAG